MTSERIDLNCEVRHIRCTRRLSHQVRYYWNNHGNNIKIKFHLHPQFNWNFTCISFAFSPTPLVFSLFSPTRTSTPPHSLSLYVYKYPTHSSSFHILFPQPAGTVRRERERGGVRFFILLTGSEEASASLLEGQQRKFLPLFLLLANSVYIFVAIFVSKSCFCVGGCVNIFVGR